MRVFGDLSKFIHDKAPTSLNSIPRHLNHPLVTHRPLILNAHSITSTLHFSNLADPTRFVRGWHDLLKDVVALEGVRPTIVLPPPGRDGKGWMRPPSSSSLPEIPPIESGPSASTPLESRLLWINSLHRQTSSPSSLPPFSSLPRPKPPIATQTTPSILRGWSEDQAFWVALRSLSPDDPSSSSQEAFSNAVLSHRRKIAKQIWLDQKKDSRPTEEDKEEVIEVMRLMGVRIVRAREGGESLERVCRLVLEEEQKSGKEGLVLSSSYVPLLYGSSTLHYTPQSPILPVTPTPFTHASLPTLLSTLFPANPLSLDLPHPDPLASLVNLALLTGYPELGVPKIPQLAFVRAWGAITEYGSPEQIEPTLWKFGKSVKQVMRWEEWLQTIRRAREEFSVGEGMKEGEGWVEEGGGEEGRDEVGLSEFFKEKVEGREGLMGGEFWDEVAEELGSTIGE